MNPAIFLFTLLVRFTQLPSLLGLMFVSIVLPAVLSTLCRDQELATALTDLFVTPAVPMLMGLMFVRDGIANWRAGKDAEYLALLFTRPLRRADYVISKWLAGSLLVTMVMLVQILVFEAVQLAYGHTKLDLLEPHVLANCVLNAFSFTAMMVLIACVPLRLGVWLFGFLYYIAILGSSIAEFSLSFSLKQSSYTNGFMFLVMQGVLWVMQAIHSFAFPSLDSYDTLYALNFSWQPIIHYCLNISLYLLAASYIVNKREFFYATD